MEQFKHEGFIGCETLEFKALWGALRLQGEIGCLGNIVIGVDKYIDIVGGYGRTGTVQTKWYAYNVFIRNGYNIFRYDNQDQELFRNGHLDQHHKHLFDWRTGQEMPGSPVWIGEEGWLNLGEVIREVSDWYWIHKNELQYPDSFPELDVR